MTDAAFSPSARSPAPEELWAPDWSGTKAESEMTVSAFSPSARLPSLVCFLVVVLVVLACEVRVVDGRLVCGV